MKFTQTTLQKTFTIIYRGRTYHIDYLNSDGQILGLINRDHWMVYDEYGEELQIYLFKDDTEKEKRAVERNMKIAERLIDYCIKHFNDKILLEYEEFEKCEKCKLIISRKPS